MSVPTPTGTGFTSVDDALGGLITGDNVVWQCDDPVVYDALRFGFAAAAARDGQRVLHLSFSARPGPGPGTVSPTIERLDAGPGSAYSRPRVLTDELDRRFRDDRPDCVIVDDLAGPIRRWGSAVALDFFSRTCPAMLQAGVTAYWCVGSDFGRSSLDAVRQITQCYIEVRDERLRVIKAEGRAASQQGVSYRLHIEGGDVAVTAAPTGGRLARGLASLRADFRLTQHDLATIGGVTASAISQAESGARGLSVDTLLRISDELDVPLDRLVNASPRPRYHLARHDRSRRVDDDTVALVPDTSIGARVFLIELAPGASASPDHPHHGVEVIAMMAGLVQIDLGDDRPVLRAGDTIVVAESVVNSWRNLRREPARFFRILRD